MLPNEQLDLLIKEANEHGLLRNGPSIVEVLERLKASRESVEELESSVSSLETINRDLQGKLKEAAAVRWILIGLVVILIGAAVFHMSLEVP